MRISLKLIHDKAKYRPEGYYDEVISHGAIDGNELVLNDDVYWQLCRKYNPPLPSKVQMAANFAVSIAKFAASGFALVDERKYAERAGTCLDCPHIVEDPEHWRCSKCGCYDIKLWMATAQCPDKPPRWLKVQ